MPRLPVHVLRAVAVLSLLVVVSGATSLPAAATSGPCPMDGTCTVKSASGLYLTWDPTRATPSPVHLAANASLPGAFWNLGYDGFEIKVGTVGVTLCLAAVPERGRRRRVGIELSRCRGGPGQQWTLVGTMRFGSQIQIRSEAHGSMCLTAGKRRGRARRSGVVLERCAARGNAPDQTWST